MRWRAVSSGWLPASKPGPGERFHMLDEVFLDANTLMADRPDAGDEALLVRFHLVPKQDAVATAKEGRPIYRDVEYVTISPPGERFNVPDKRATDYDRRRFRRQYAAFKSGQGETLHGTPLSKWPLMSAAQVEELKYFHVRTVEALATMPDGNIPNVGNISHLKKLAVDYLEIAKGQAPAIQLRAELEKRDETLGALQRQMAEQAAVIARLTARSEAEDATSEPAQAEQGSSAPKRIRNRKAVPNGDV